MFLNLCSGTGEPARLPLSGERLLPRVRRRALVPRRRAPLGIFRASAATRLRPNRPGRAPHSRGQAICGATAPRGCGRAGLPVFDTRGGGPSEAFAGAFLDLINQSKVLIEIRYLRNYGVSRMTARWATRIRHARRWL